ncbi:hypothetical protein [Devosia sp. 2618]|uniref:hypothetical protein n=1 Tax=Devosia sp. 2618 TaxID=3156454 RepID=UPI003393F20E
MRLSAIATVLLLSTSGAAFAQNLDALTQALDHLPEFILTNPDDPIQARFVDVSALFALPGLAGEEAKRENLLRLQVGSGLYPVDALFRNELADWQERAGISLSEVQYFVGLASPPNVIALWGMETDADAATFFDTLKQHDFVPFGGDDGVLGNGEPMKIDFDKRDPANPWRSSMGAATFVATKGNAIVQASSPAAVPVLLNDGPSVADNPIVATALKGLDQSVGDGWIVQAMLISPAFGMGGFDLADLVSLQPGNLDELRSKLESQIAGLSEGIPPYFGGIIADVQLENPAVAIALTYADCDTAEAAARQIGGRWKASMPETAQGTITTTHGEGVDGLCAALFTVVGDTEDPTTNPIFGRFFEQYMRRDFTVLQVGNA